MPNSARPGALSLEGALAALGPGSDSRIARSISAARRRQLEAFVELHRDVGAEQILDLDRALGRELDHARRRDASGRSRRRSLTLRSSRERHDLEAAGIGQDRRAASS